MSYPRGQFLGELNMVEAGGFSVRMADALTFCYRHPVLGMQYFVVPQGFRSDFASVPRFLWPVLPPHGRVRKSAVLHDWMYTQATIPRAYADTMFLEAMAVDGVPWLQRVAMYLGVRIFGGIFRN